MKPIVRALEGLLPALLLGCGAGLLVGGLLVYAPATLGQPRVGEASPAAGDPLLSSPLATTPPGPDASPAGPAAIPLATNPPAPASPTQPPSGYAARVVVPSLGIDLPVVAGDLVVPGNRDNYPLCDVAMYLTQYAQPSQAGTTYIYAHAQRGMFGPLLQAAQVDNGAALLGALVEVYTTDDRLYLYEIDRIKRHATDMSIAQLVGGQQLVLQTSEGPAGTIPKLQISALPVGVVPAAHGDADPEPHPRVCLPTG